MDRIITVGDEVIADGIYMVYIGFGKFLATDGSGIYEESEVNITQKTDKVWENLANELIKAGVPNE